MFEIRKGRVRYKYPFMEMNIGEEATVEIENDNAFKNIKQCANHERNKSGAYFLVERGLKNKVFIKRFK